MEQWKPIDGFEQYEVSDLGRVRSRKSGFVMKPRVGKTGCLRINLWADSRKHTLQINQVVARAFVSNPKGFKQVRHKNGRLYDCRACNLVWGGRRRGVGDLDHFAVLKSYLENDMTTAEIANAFDVSYWTIGRILRHYGVKLDAPGTRANRRRHEAARQSFADEFPDIPYPESSWARRSIRIGSRRRDRGITWQALMKRDGNMCSICGQEVDPEISAGAFAPTVDHVVAIANGGTDTWDNVALAHVGCNAKKGLRSIKEMQVAQ